MTAVVRFGWDVSTQTYAHLLTFGVLSLYIIYYKIRFSLRQEGLLAAFFCVLLYGLFGVSDNAIARNRMLILFDAGVIAYVFSHFSLEKKKYLLHVPVLVSLWFVVVLFVYFLKNPRLYFTENVLPTDFIVNYSVVGGYLALTLPLSLAFWKDGEKGSPVIAVLILCGIVLTKSRVALFASAITGVLYIHRYHKHYAPLMRIVFALSIVLLGLLTISKTYQYHTPLAGILGDRLVWWKTAFSMFKTHVLFGIGWSNYGNMFTLYRDAATLNTLYAHNIVFQLLAETGIIGFALFCTILYSFYESIRPHLNNPTYGALFLSSCAFLFINMFDYSFYVPGTLLLYSLVLGAAYFPDTGFVKTEKKLLVRAIIAAPLFLAATFIVVKPLLAEKAYSVALQAIDHNNYEEAEHALLRASTYDPLSSIYVNEHAHLYFLMFTATKQESYLQKAIAKEKEAINLFTTNAAYWSDLAWLLWTNNEKKEALQAITTALQYDRFNERYIETARLFHDNRL